jgi:hypothetical protein
MGGGALDKPPQSVDSNDNSSGGHAPNNDNPLLLQTGNELSNPNNSIANKSPHTDNNHAKIGQPDRFSSNLKFLDNLHGSIVAPPTIVDKSANLPKVSAERGIKIASNTVTEHARKPIHIYRPIEIKVEGLDGSQAPKDLKEAKENFLANFGKHGGDATTARQYINDMIAIHHDKAEYAKQHPNQRVRYVKDKDLAAAINEFNKIPGAKRMGTAAEFSNAEINGKTLRCLKAVCKPETQLNQGQIGSCALTAAVGYTIELDPKHAARVASQVLRTGEYRGVFTKRDMGPEAGQTDSDHIFSTAMKRCVYKGKHIDANYGGTDDKNLAEGIKRFTWGELHAVWSDKNTVSNGADLDITMNGNHCQRTIWRVFKENGQLVAKEKTDNTWSGYGDGHWRPAS